MTRALPVIDLGRLSDDGASLAEVAASIGAACRDIGFFYVVDHGVSPGLMEEAIAIEKIGGNRGYSGLLHEALDPARGADRKEAFNIGFELAPDDPELLAGKPFRALNAWPNVPGFRGTLIAYYDACAALGARIHRAFAAD